MAQLPDSAAAAWETLDVDDSDIRLGPPCASPLPLPRPCSSTPTAHPHQDDPSHHNRIPEPAAAAAAQDTTRLSSAADSPPAALGRGDARAPDADFLLPPWLCALQFLGRDRAWEQPGIKAIKEEALYRAPLVAGVVTSCKPNGLGDLLITLRDPSDTVAASVHKKVLLESNNDQDISISCVIVLSKVAVFRPTRKACYLNVTKVLKIFRKDCDAPPIQVISSSTTERSEGSTDNNNIMMRLLRHERMIASSNKMTVIKVSPQHQGTSESINSISTQAMYGRCSRGNNKEGGLMAGDPCRKNTLNCSTDGHPQQNLNIRNMTCSQPSLCRSTFMIGDRYSAQASDNEKLLHSRKKLKSDATLPDGYAETGNSRIDTESNQILKRNMNTELDGMPEQFSGQHASIWEPVEHQQRNLTAVNAGNVQPTKECASATSGSLINPQKALPVASLGGWTDDQISELFSDL